MSTDARQLAEALSQRTDDSLAALFTARDVRSDQTWQNFFDVAEALLDPAAVAPVVQRLPRELALALASGIPAKGLSELALSNDSGEAFAVVKDAASGRPRPEPTSAEAVAVTEADAAHAAERAFTHVASVAELLFELRSSPLSLLINGSPNATERRKLAELLPPTSDPDDVVGSAVASRLAVAFERKLYLSELGELWLSLPTIRRWEQVAAGFVSGLPASIRPHAQEAITPPTWPGAEPWNPDWQEVASGMLVRAVSRGLASPEGGVFAWSNPRNSDALSAYVPQEVDRLFLQNDLTAIAPGPLAPALDLRLRAAAERESAAQASSYRFSEASIARAVAGGETGSSLREFLTGMSLTGIPQALDYLLERADSQRGVVQVRPSGTRAILSSTDPHLLQTISVDQSLRHLGFIVDEELLGSRASAVNVAAALSEAKYAVVLLDETGEAVKARSHTLKTPDAPQPSETYRSLIARIRSNHDENSEAAWLARELEAAAASRALLVVEVAMPDGTSRELNLEVSGFAGGRLRGHDRAAEVERTLPISHIRSIRPLP
jgi:hypothetical protein